MTMGRLRDRFRKGLRGISHSFSKLMATTEPKTGKFGSQRMCPFCGLITARSQRCCLECGRSLGSA